MGNTIDYLPYYKFEEYLRDVEDSREHIHTLLPDGYIKKHFHEKQLIDVLWYIELHHIYKTDKSFQKFVKEFVIDSQV